MTCPDTTVVDGKQFKNYEAASPAPNPTFAQAFAASCNTTMVQYADELTGEQLASAGKDFGFGAKWDLGLDAYSGSVPADNDLVTRAADMIGQGKVVASPLMMAMVAAAVDSGVSRTPTLLPGEKPGTRLDELDPATIGDLQRMMRLVVTEGTGGAVNLPGLPVHAKTGTAEYAKGNGHRHERLDDRLPRRRRVRGVRRERVVGRPRRGTDRRRRPQPAPQRPAIVIDCDRVAAAKPRGRLNKPPGPCSRIQVGGGGAELRGLPRAGAGRDPRQHRDSGEPGQVVEVAALGEPELGRHGAQGQPGRLEPLTPQRVDGQLGVVQRAQRRDW